MKSVKKFIRSHIVFVVAFAAAIIAAPFAQDNNLILTYIDYRTIGLLFCILAAVQMLANAGMFRWVASLFGRAFSTPRAAIFALVAITMLLSMFVTNDMSLVVMLPLSSAVLIHAHWIRLIPFCFIVQNLAANLGGMLLPFGNPQNLYLFGHYHLSIGDFLSAMLPPFIVAVLLVALCCFAGPKLYRDLLDRNMATSSKSAARISGPSTAASTSEDPTLSADSGPARSMLKPRNFGIGVALFIFTVLAVFRIVPYELAVIVVLVALLIFDRRALLSVDWFLLLTFVCFFIFAGIVSHIPAVREVLSALMHDAPLYVSAATSQVISNVPSAVLLSQVTEAWKPLLVGVNVGAAGTIVASLASLITMNHFKNLRAHSAAATQAELPTVGRFVLMLMEFGFAFLVVLLVVVSFLG